jgi:uncharacterized membrane protein
VVPPVRFRPLDVSMAASPPRSRATRERCANPRLGLPLTQPGPNRQGVKPLSGRERRGWMLALGTGLGIVALASLPPFVGEGARPWIMQAFVAVCHQLPDRSPSINGVQLAVCHRCYGIYWGIPMAALAYLGIRGAGMPPRKMAPWILAASLFPIAVDWGGDFLGFFENTPASRVLTGLVFGLVAGFFFVVSLVQATTKQASPPNPSDPPDVSERPDPR